MIRDGHRRSRHRRQHAARRHLEGPINYRDLDAAIRAYFDNGDSLPLLRLIASENNDNEAPDAAEELTS